MGKGSVTSISALTPLPTKRNLTILRFLFTIKKMATSRTTTKKNMWGRHVSLLLSSPPYIFDLEDIFQIRIQPWNVGAAITRRSLCRPMAPCALCSRDSGASELESRYDTEKILAPNTFVSFVCCCCCCCFVSFCSLFLSSLKSLNICTLVYVYMEVGDLR